MLLSIPVLAAPCMLSGVQQELCRCMLSSVQLKLRRPQEPSAGVVGVPAPRCLAVACSVLIACACRPCERSRKLRVVSKIVHAGSCADATGVWQVWCCWRWAGSGSGSVRMQAAGLAVYGMHCLAGQCVACVSKLVAKQRLIWSRVCM